MTRNPNQIATPSRDSRFPFPIRFEIQTALALAALGAVLMATNPWFTAVDDEVVIIDVAARPLLQTIKLFLGGGGQHEHPPLSDLVLHEWLWLTNGNLHWLRLPSVVFYLLGAWLLVQTARRLGADRAGTCTLILLLFWPYGFHYGRIAGWYSFTFMLVSLLTLIYSKYLEDPSPKMWFSFALCALALVYTNYLGWALLACLGLDLLLRFARDIRKLVLFVSTAALLVLACLPIMPAFLGEVHRGARPAPSIAALTIGVYNLYCLFVSESVAPWFWAPGIAAGLAITCAMLLVLIYARSLARRLFLYFSALLLAITFLQIGNTKRLLMISPWLILPVGVTIATVTLPSTRRWLVGSLVLVGLIGWYGIFSRNLYAAPHWVEPWEQVSSHAAQVVAHRGVVIANNPSFFFYLTYLLPSTNPSIRGHFAGLLPISVQTPNVYTPQQWVDAGSPAAQTVFLADGLNFEMPGPAIEDLRSALDSRCRIIDEQRLVHDSGAEWKRKYQPVTGQRSWRIRVNSYTCPAL